MGDLQEQKISYWKAKVIVFVGIILNFVISFFLLSKLSDFGLIHSKSGVPDFFVLISLGMFLLLAYLFKKGFIFSPVTIVGVVGGDIYYRPSQDFYAYFWLLFILVLTLFLFSIYAIMVT